MILTTLAAITLFLCLTIRIEGHSHLGNPLPTRRLDCRAGNGRHRDCYGPCPALDTYGEPTGISPSRPAEVWKRGEQRTISWHRNNHANGESGFVRLTLVPVDQMMDKRAHEKFTFQVSCWASGLHQCYSRKEQVCGNDAEGKAYKAPITVPSAYPDGVYVFGWAWYGGGDYRETSFFGDYYSCSFVRIQGGVSVSAQSRPVFLPGSNTKYNDACMSATDRVGVCSREPCHGHQVRKMTPRNLPRFISSRDLGSQQQIYSIDQNNQRPQPNAETLNKPNTGRGSFRIEGLQIFDLVNNRIKVAKSTRVRVRTSKYKRGFTLGLKVSGSVEYVKFDMPGLSHTEYKTPYVVNGDNDGKLVALRCRKNQNLRLTATVYGSGREEKKSYSVKCI